MGGREAGSYEDIVTAVNQVLERTRAFLPEMRDVQQAIRGSAGDPPAIGAGGRAGRGRDRRRRAGPAGGGGAAIRRRRPGGGGAGRGGGAPAPGGPPLPPAGRPVAAPPPSGRRVRLPRRLLQRLLRALDGGR